MAHPLQLTSLRVFYGPLLSNGWLFCHLVSTPLPCQVKNPTNMGNKCTIMHVWYIYHSSPLKMFTKLISYLPLFLSLSPPPLPTFKTKSFKFIMLCFLMDLHLFSLYACVWFIYKLIFVVFL